MFHAQLGPLVWEVSELLINSLTGRIRVMGVGLEAYFLSHSLSSLCFLIGQGEYHIAHAVKKQREMNVGA